MMPLNGFPVWPGFNAATAGPVLKADQRFASVLPYQCAVYQAKSNASGIGQGSKMAPACALLNVAGNVDAPRCNRCICKL